MISPSVPIQRDRQHKQEIMTAQMPEPIRASHLMMCHSSVKHVTPTPALRILTHAHFLHASR